MIPRAFALADNPFESQFADVIEDRLPITVEVLIVMETRLRLPQKTLQCRLRVYSLG